MNNSIGCEPRSDLCRYVVLHHRPLSVQSNVSGDVSGRGKTLPRGVAAHFDWMFENGDSLLTWATDSLPSVTLAATVPAIQLPGHRAVYLTFEGPLSGERGQVSQVERGCFRAVCVSADHCEFAVTGNRAGTIVFQRHQRGVEVTWDWSFRPTRADAS